MKEENALNISEHGNNKKNISPYFDVILQTIK